MVSVWLALVFVLGAVVGRLLHRCIDRLPYEKSLLWPGARCERCHTTRRWHETLPLCGFFLARGRCHTCGRARPLRELGMELFTGLGFLGMFYLVLVVNVHELPTLDSAEAMLARGEIPWDALLVFVHHALLFSFLLAASVIDLDHFEIPLPITTTGSIVGLVLATLFPWPWPNPAAAAPGTENLPWGGLQGHVTPVPGLYPWPLWGPLPESLPAGTWQLGLATGVAGLLAGMILLRLVRFLFSAGLGVEAMGMGDVDLMMMAGSFLGWQPVTLAFLVGVFPALVFALLHKIGQALAGPRRILVEMGEVQPNGQPWLKVDGQLVTTNLTQALAEKLAKERKTSVRIDTLPLDLWVEHTVTTLQSAAEQAGVRRVTILDPRAQPSLFKDLFSLLGRLFPSSPRVTLSAQATHQDGRPLLLAAGHRLGVEALPTALKELAAHGRQGELALDPAPLLDLMGQSIGQIHTAARTAGLDDVRPLDRGIPFGPGLSAGVLITLLCWPAFGPVLQIFFFDGVLMTFLTGFCAAFLLLAALLLRLMRRGRGSEPTPGVPT